MANLIIKIVNFSKSLECLLRFLFFSVLVFLLVCLSSYLFFSIFALMFLISRSFRICLIFRLHSHLLRNVLSCSLPPSSLPPSLPHSHFAFLSLFLFLSLARSLSPSSLLLTLAGYLSYGRFFLAACFPTAIFFSFPVSSTFVLYFPPILYLHLFPA